MKINERPHGGVHDCKKSGEDRIDVIAAAAVAVACPRIAFSTGVAARASRSFKTMSSQP